MSLTLDLKGNHLFFFPSVVMHVMWELIPWPGLNLNTLHWKLRLLTTGPPGKSQKPFLLRTSYWPLLLRQKAGKFSWSLILALLCHLLMLLFSEDDGPSCLLLFILEVFKKLFKIQLLPESNFCLLIFLHLLCFSLMKRREGAWVSPQWNYLNYETVYCQGLP